MRKHNQVILSLVLMLGVIYACGGLAQRGLKKDRGTSSLVASYYRNYNTDTIEFIHIMMDGSGISQIFGNITYSKKGITRQVSERLVSLKQMDMRQVEEQIFGEDYRDKFDAYRKVMFIQFPIDSKSPMQIAQLRNIIEDHLDRELLKSGAGQWITGDTGEGGSNMLFFVNDWDTAYKIALKVLDSHDQLNEAIIARRLSFSAVNWNYEIVYPLFFEGEFNTR